MQKLKMTLNEQGKVSNILQDFKIMRGSYGNILMQVEVPQSLLIEVVKNDGQPITGNNVRIGAIIRTATGKNLPTKKYELSFVKEIQRDGIDYFVYQRKCPKIFTCWETVSLLEKATSGLLELVINVVNWTLSDEGAKIEETTTSQIIPIEVYQSEFFEEEEKIDSPSDFDLLQAQVQEISKEVDETQEELFGNDSDDIGGYILKRLIAGDKILFEKDLSTTPNRIKISVEKINANEVAIKTIEGTDAQNVQEILEELEKRALKKGTTVFDDGKQLTNFDLKDIDWAKNSDYAKKATPNEELDNRLKSKIENVTYNSKTGVLTFLKEDEEIIVDLPIERLLKDGYYDAISKNIVLQFDDENSLEIPFGDMVGEYFADEATIEQYVDTTDGNKLKYKISSAYKSKIDENTSARHTHSNKELLDSYNQSNEDITDAVKKKHSHANEEILEATTESFTKELKETIETVNNSYVSYSVQQKTEDEKAQARKNIGAVNLPIGSIISSAIPLTDAGFHLLDGETISQEGVYSEFCNLLKTLSASNPNIICSQSEFDSDVARTGNCGKFVIDNSAGTVRLPKITRFIQGLSDINNIGTSLSESLPDITGPLSAGRTYGFDTFFCTNSDTSLFHGTESSGWRVTSTTQETISGKYNKVEFKASRANPIYGGVTVQPQATQYPYYIVLATVTQSEVEVNINNIVTDLNDKASHSYVDQKASQVETNTKNYSDNRIDNLKIKIERIETFSVTDLEAQAYGSYTHTFKTPLTDKQFVSSVLFMATGSGAYSNSALAYCSDLWWTTTQCYVGWNRLSNDNKVSWSVIVTISEITEGERQ